MSESSFVVQKVEWVQLRAPSGESFFVMISSLPNGFFTAVPCQIQLVHGDHSLIGLGASADAALEQVQKNLEGKTREQIFPGAAG